MFLVSKKMWAERLNIKPLLATNKDPTKRLQLHQNNHPQMLASTSLGAGTLPSEGGGRRTVRDKKNWWGPYGNKEPCTENEAPSPKWQGSSFSQGPHEHALKTWLGFLSTYMAHWLSVSQLAICSTREDRLGIWSPVIDARRRGSFGGVDSSIDGLTVLGHFLFSLLHFASSQMSKNSRCDVARCG